MRAQQGISYRTALRWWKAGQIQSYQAPTGTIIVAEKKPEKATVILRIALYACISSHEHKENLERQAERLQDYCAPTGYQIAAVAKAIASGVHDTRPKFLALLRDSRDHDHCGRAHRSGDPVWFPVFGNAVGTARKRL
jgi:putative resolvase